METNLDTFDALYGFDPSFDPNRQQTYLPLNHLHHQTWPLPLSPGTMSQQQQSPQQQQMDGQVQQQQQQQQRRVHTIATTSHQLPAAAAVAPLQTTGLGFTSMMTTASTANPMLKEWI